MNTLTLVSKSHIMHNITIFHSLRNGFPFSYMTVLNVNEINTSTKKSKLLLHNRSEHAPSFNYRFSMDTKGPINPPSHSKSYIHVIIDAFSHFVVTVPIKSNNAKTAIKTLLHHWIIKFGPPIYLVTDRGNKEMAYLYTYGYSSFS